MAQEVKGRIVSRNVEKNAPVYSRIHRCILATTHRCITEPTGASWPERTGAFQNPPVCFRTHRCVLNSTVVGIEPGPAETCVSKCCAQPIELPLHCLTMMNHPSRTTRLSYHSSPLHGTHPTSCMRMLRTTLHLTSCVLKEEDDHQRRRQLVHVTAAAAAAEFSDDDQRSTLAVIVR